MSEDIKYGEEGYKEMHDILPYYQQSMHESYPWPSNAGQHPNPNEGSMEYYNDRDTNPNIPKRKKKK